MTNPWEENKEEKRKLLDKKIKITFKLKNLLSITFIILIFIIGILIGIRLNKNPLEEGLDLDENQSITTQPSLNTSANSLEDTETITNDTNNTSTGELINNENSTTTNTTNTNTTTNSSSQTGNSTGCPNASYVSNYNNVFLDVRGVEYEWHDTWGKITKVMFTITNSEEGIIQPVKFTYYLDGYQNQDPPYTKEEKLLSSHQSLCPGQEVEAAFLSEYLYNQAVIDPEQAVLVLTLLDDDGGLIKETSQTLDLTE